MRQRSATWLLAAAALWIGYAVVCASLRLLQGSPSPLVWWLAAGFVVVPVAFLFSFVVHDPGIAERVLVQSVVVAGTVSLVALVYVVLVGGIAGPPTADARPVLTASLVATCVAIVLAVPLRHRLVAAVRTSSRSRRRSTAEAVTAFGARMSRAIPMDELLLQLAESLRATLPGTRAEIWTGTDGDLARTVSVPALPAARLHLDEHERVVIGQSRIGARAWGQVWLPMLLDPAGEADVRLVPVAHLGELLGLVVVRRPDDAPVFSSSDEQALVELARQLGLALHNVRLDSALQASLRELAERNAQLQASRLRIVNAADTSRREIERNLHDGAQQHLVALAVRLGIAQEVAEPEVSAMLADLRVEVQSTIRELRELAHGIYPPLLRDQGLGEALRAASLRTPQPCTVDIDLPGRYPVAIETAAYFCLLEAMQNAAKYAGPTARLALRAVGGDGVLTVELADDGTGFDPVLVPRGSGMLNMQDRIGALDGTLEVTSAPNRGTTVRAVIPVPSAKAASGRPALGQQQ